MKHVFRGHQFAEAGREDHPVGIALEKHTAVFAIDQNGVWRIDIRFVFFRRIFLLRDHGGRLLRGCRRSDCARTKAGG